MPITDSYLQAAALLIGTIVIIAFTNDQVARKHPRDVRVVWYLFALAATISLVLACWAHSYGAIDSAGNFQGRTGSVLSFLLKASLDLQSSIVLCLAIVAVVLVPQIVSYVLSGLSGCAAAPIFIGGTVSFFAWGLIKSLAVASGVALVIPLYAYLHQWNNATANQALGMALLSAMLVSLAFAALFIYRGMLSVPKVVRQVVPARLQNVLSVTKVWLTRRDQPPSP